MTTRHHSGVKRYRPEPYKPIVTQIPLGELWTHDGAPVPAKRVRFLDSGEVHDLIRQRPDLDLIVARGAEPLKWLYGDEKWTFWKEELKGRIADPEASNLSRRLGRRVVLHRVRVGRAWHRAGHPPCRAVRLSTAP